VLTLPPAKSILDAAESDWLTVTAQMSHINFGGAFTIDKDWFRFDLASPATVFFDIDSVNAADALDTVLEVFASTNLSTPIGSNDDGYDFRGFTAPDDNPLVAVSREPSLFFDNLAIGTYYIRVYALNGTGGTTDGATCSTSGTTCVTGGEYHLRLLQDNTSSVAPQVLNSRPGSAHTLYLDFDGHSASDVWGTYTATPFSLDGTGNSFSPAERLAIQNIWSIVADDYSPFDINVTTVNPGTFRISVPIDQSSPTALPRSLVMLQPSPPVRPALRNSEVTFPVARTTT
jgi:hypothetical protein